jgi:hypothetical protein
MIYASPTALEETAGFLDANPTAGLVYTDYPCKLLAGSPCGGSACTSSFSQPVGAHLGAHLKVAAEGQVAELEPDCFRHVGDHRTSDRVGPFTLGRPWWKLPNCPAILPHALN